MPQFNANDLLRNRNPAAPLGPFDGRVAALHPTRPQFYITTPNADDIFLPPGPDCVVYARFDARYGHDDHTQWPQPFSRSAPHLACILKKGESRENSVIWDNPEYRDFVKLGGDAIGMGKLSVEWIQDLEKSYRWLMDELALRRSNISAFSSHPLLASLSNDLERSLNRLRAVAMTYRGATVSLRLVQRLWLELLALMDYIEFYQPTMEGRAPAVKRSTKIIGCFVRDIDAAERLFAAGIPFWLIRETQTFHSENILSVSTVVQPRDLIVLDDYSGYTARVYFGDSNYNRYLAIHNHTINYIRYANPFTAGNTKGINPFEYDLSKSSASQAGPTRREPYRANVRGGQPYVKKNSGATPRRDKFDVLCNPYMPPCLDAWRIALRNVNQSVHELDASNLSSENDGRYPFPEPAIIASGENRNLYLTIWDFLRPVVINRMSSNLGGLQLISNQQWRLLLGRRRPRENTRSAKSRLLVSDLLTPDSAEMGIDLSLIYDIPAWEYSELETRQSLWDLAELSFRFELLMLDQRATAATARQIENPADRENILSPLIREPNVLKCFPFDTSEPRHLGFVSTEHARKGLASNRIQDRLPYLHALRRVMHWWDGYSKDHVARLPFWTPDADIHDLEHYESAIAHFYTQTFYCFFGRAAVVPMYLP